MKRIESYCKLRKGILNVRHESQFRDAIKTLPDGNYKIVIEKIYNKRSTPQNAYLWGVVYPIIKEGLIDAGFDEFNQDHDLEMTHELCKYRFLEKEIEGKTGSIRMIGSTKDLTTTLFMAYLSEIQKWSSEYLGVYIPEPDPNYATFEPIL